MTKQTFVDPFFSIDGIDLSNRVESLSLDRGAETNDASAGGDLTRNMLPGLLTWALEITFRQDYATGSVDDTLFSKMGTVVAVIIRPKVAVVSAANPEYTGNAILTAAQPLAGSVGAVIDTPASFVPAGDLARAVA